MKNLTNDIYVWPNRPDGAGVSIYDYRQARYYRRDTTNQMVRYNLWGMATQQYGDCQDFSAYLESQGRSLGISGIGKVHLGTPYGTLETSATAVAAFNTVPLVPCGTYWFNPYSPYAPYDATAYGFNFHQLTYWASGGGIYDWTSAFCFPDGVHPWTLSIGFSQGQETLALIASIPPGNVPSGNQPAWSPMFDLGSNDPVFGVWYGGTWPTILSSLFPPPPIPP